MSIEQILTEVYATFFSDFVTEEPGLAMSKEKKHKIKTPSSNRSYLNKKMSNNSKISLNPILSEAKDYNGDIKKWIADILDQPNYELDDVKVQINTFTQNLISKTARNKDIYSILKAHTKDSDEMALVLLTERKLLVQIITTLTNKLAGFENLKNDYEELAKKDKVQKSQIRELNNELINIRRQLKYLDNSNSKLIYNSFIKEMRDVETSKSNERLTRYKLHKQIKSIVAKSKLKRWDSISKMIAKLSKSCGRDSSQGTETNRQIVKPGNLYSRRDDIHSFSFKYNSKERVESVRQFHNFWSYRSRTSKSKRLWIKAQKCPWEKIVMK